jgi:hypothetical protein
LTTVLLGTSVGGGSVSEQINIGSVRNWGYEALFDVQVLTSDILHWDVNLNGSVNHNQLVHADPAAGFGAPTAGGGVNVQGYPLGSNFAYPIHYADANKDGIIEPSEVTLGANPTFVGPGYPPMQATAGTTLGIFANHVRISAQFDYRGGAKLLDLAAYQSCYDGFCAATTRRGTPLAEQADAVATSIGNGSALGYYSDGSFIRFRELSVTYTLAHAVARYLRATDVSVTLSARNLALWTRYKGVDPEVFSSIGTNTPYNDFGGIPIAQYWLARINIGL